MSATNILKEELKELYYQNFSLWAEMHLELLKEKQYDLVDWDNLYEELEDMANSDLKACISYLIIILEHLYKLDNFKNLAGGETAGKEWIKSVENSRYKISRLLTKYPSLRQKLPLELQDAWEDAIVELKIWLNNNDYNPENFKFPEKCPYTYEETMTRDLEEPK